MMTRRALVVLAALSALLTAGMPAHADDRAPRERIARERADADARFEQRRKACSERFAVTSCVDEARAEHRQALQQLRGEEAVLDAAQRRERAAARLAGIEQKQRAEREHSVAPRPVRERKVSEPKPPRSASGAPRAAPMAASAADRSAEEARSRQRFEARQREARQHREQAEQRQAQREQNGATHQPLPDPAAR